jgi:CHASE3 domain sensor protein
MSLGDAGVAARAYVLTGDESWLRAHAAALTRLDDRLKQLSGLTVDQPAQRKKLAQLETLKAELADSLNQLIESRKSHGQDSASEARLILQSIEERNKFRLILAQMEAEEYGFVSSKISASDASSRLTVLLWILGTVTALTFLAIVFHLLQREIRERKLAEMRLQAAHHET